MTKEKEKDCKCEDFVQATEDNRNQRFMEPCKRGDGFCLRKGHYVEVAGQFNFWCEKEEGLVDEEEREFVFSLYGKSKK